MKRVNHLDSNGVTILTTKTLAKVTAGNSGTAKKFGVQNVGDEALASVELQIDQVGSGDGYSMVEWQWDSGTIPAPWGVSAAVQTNAGSTSWGAVNAGRKYYVVSALLGSAETGPSLEVFADVVNVGASLGDHVVVSWQTVPSATAYRVYRSIVSGDYTAPTRIAEVAAPGTNWTDSGATPPTGAPPSENPTGGASPNFGVPPTGGFQTTPLVVGAFPIGKTVFYWVRVTVPLGASSTGNPRKASLEVVET